MEHNYFVDTRWTWRERLGFKLFPSHLCPTPEVVDPARYTDVLIVNVVASLSLVDRLRVLVTGKLKVQTHTLCEHAPGDVISSSVAYPVLG